ncbi:MAG: preprotein translocase subunit SecY [Firmicutes bacterium]|nr:preprotein translocase subunit SecY [Bacillota bacterium]
MLQTLINAFKNKDIRKKILITLGLLFIFRLASYIPVPGIHPGVFGQAGGEGIGNILWLLSSLTGGALQNGALVALGIAPYINASIIVQLLTVAIPKLEKWSKEGEEGKRKINNVTRVLTLVLAIAQATGIVVNYALTTMPAEMGGGSGLYPIFGMYEGSARAEWLIGIIVAVTLIAGAMFTMWLGERITELGVGNGISLLIFVGIVSSAGLAIMAMIPTFGYEPEAPWILAGFLLMVLAVFAFIVFVDLSERRIPIQYAKQIKGRKQYGGQSTFIPIKVNAAGVLPIIFANAITTFPQLLFSLFPGDQTVVDGQLVSGWARFVHGWQTWGAVRDGGVGALAFGGWAFSLATGILIFFFSYFYARIQFNPEEVSRNIQQYGGFVPGIRPGKPTTDYLTKITRRITFWGATFLAFIAIVPSILFATVLPPGNPLLHGFTATGMLIVVSVALEFEKQLQSQLMMKQYKGFLK